MKWVLVLCLFISAGCVRRSRMISADKTPHYHFCKEKHPKPGSKFAYCMSRTVNKTKPYPEFQKDVRDNTKNTCKDGVKIYHEGYDPTCMKVGGYILFNGDLCTVERVGESYDFKDFGEWEQLMK